MDSISTRSSSDRPAIVGGRPYRSVADQIIYGAPLIGEAEISAVTECMRSRWIGLGPRVREFEIAFAEYKGAPYATAVNSGSAALHLALIAIGIGDGDEVIVPTMTFCASAHAVIHAGGAPVFVDCQRSTYNIDSELIERAISPRTKAIMVVHIGGRCCDMRAVLALARKYKLRVIEDCAHAIESEYFETAAGLLGDVGCFSFYATKSITTADGGMVITNDEEIHRAVRQLVAHGVNRDAWTRIQGRGNSYDVYAAGFKYNMTDIEASIGLAQLRGVETRWNSRRMIWQWYDELLVDLPLTVPAPTEDGTRHGHHMYSVLLDIDNLNAGVSDVVEAMRAENIGTGVHYTPLHMLHYYIERNGHNADDFPAAHYVGLRTLSLPLNADLEYDDVRDVSEALRRILAYYACEQQPNLYNCARNISD